MILARMGSETKPAPGSIINWGNPLTRKLVGAWLMNDRGGAISNIAEGVTYRRLSATGSGNAYVASTPGLCLSCDGTNSSFIKTGTSGTTFTNAMSFLVKFKLSTAAGLWGIIAQTNAADAGNQAFSLNSQGSLDAKCWIGGAQTTLSAGNATAEWDTVGVTLIADGNAATFRVIRNGILTSTGSPLAGNFTNATGNFIIGAYGNNDIPMNGLISMVWLWNRALSDSEMIAASRMPYSMLLAQSPRVKYFSTAAPVPAPTLHLVTSPLRW